MMKTRRTAMFRLFSRTLADAASAKSVFTAATSMEKFGFSVPPCIQLYVPLIASADQDYHSVSEAATSCFISMVAYEPVGKKNCRFTEYFPVKQSSFCLSVAYTAKCHYRLCIWS